MATGAVAQQVLTESGIISGIRAHELNVYKAIPFAAPPVGDLRWRPPVHATSWTGTRKADAFAPACMPGEVPPTVSEDCLYLQHLDARQDRARAPAGDGVDIRRRIHLRVGLDALVLGRPACAKRRHRCHRRVPIWSAWFSCTS